MGDRDVRLCEGFKQTYTGIYCESEKVLFVKSVPALRPWTMTCMCVSVRVCVKGLFMDSLLAL